MNKKIKLNSINTLKYLIATKACNFKDINQVKISPKSTIGGIYSIINIKVYEDNKCRLIITQTINANNKTFRHQWNNIEFFRSQYNLNILRDFSLEIIHFDKINSIIISKVPYNWHTLESYYKIVRKDSNELSELIGINLANFHKKTFKFQYQSDLIKKSIDSLSTQYFPHPIYLLDKLEPETLIRELPPQGNNFINFYQRFPSLNKAIMKLITNQNSCCITHNDIQFENIFIPPNYSSKSIIKLGSLHKLSWGEPQFDLGLAIAEYLMLWLNSLIVHPTIPIHESLQQATIPLEVVQPLIVSLTRVYIKQFPEILKYYPDFFTKIIQYTGLSLVYKIISMLQSFQDFSYHNIYVMQVAKKLLCYPSKSFNSVFGLTELELNKLIENKIINCSCQ